MRLYELEQKINELTIRNSVVKNSKIVIQSGDTLLPYTSAGLHFYRCHREKYVYYVATNDHKTNIGSLELHNSIEALYNLKLQQVSTVLVDTKHQGKQIGQQLYYAALEDGVHILSGDTQTPLGAKNLEKIVNSGKYDVLYYDDREEI
jgi:ribosomal protein L23